MATPLDQHGNSSDKTKDAARVEGAETKSPVQTFTSKDWQSAKSDRSENTAASLPKVGIENSAAVLVSDKASVEDKLKAVEALSRAGKTSIEIVDKDGSKRNLTIELEKAGARTMVHLYATDDKGKDHVVLRGIKNADGSYQQQQTENGTAVSSYGDWWSKNMGERSFLSEGQSVPNRIATANDGNQFSDKRNAIAPGESPGAGTTENLSPGHRNDLPVEIVPQKTAALDTTQEPQTENPGDKLIPWNNSAEVKTVSDGERLNQLFDGVAQRAGHARRMTQVADGAVYFRAGMAIDADGSPRARQIDPTGQSLTSLRHQGGASVNAESTNYFVLPLERYQQYGVHLGDIAAVRYGDKVRFAVFADAGPKQKLGEGSMALAASLGLNNNPRHGGTERPEVEYIVFPGSGNGRPLHSRAHEDLGRHYLGKAYRKNV